MARRNDQVQQVEVPDIGDIGALAVSAATSVVKNRPVTVSVWAFGLLLAAFANGFAVSQEKQEQYDLSLQAAQNVESTELNRALREMHTAESRYYNSKGWFSCDARCQQNLDKFSMTKDAVDRVKAKRDSMLKDARSEVGIWSVFGVADVRAAFWSAWQSGKDWAARMTMYDALFMAFDSREQTLVSVALKMLFQYIVNLTMGLVGMIFFFAYNVYYLIVSYGESASSGLAFFLLVLVAGVATVGTYLFAIYGTVVGGGVYLIKQAQKQAALEGQRHPGGRPRQVQYGGGHGYGGGQYGGYDRRAHYD